MELRKGLPITEFKPGQIITRLETADFEQEQYNENLGITETVTTLKDQSYRGEPMKFLGLENNMIYVESMEGWRKGRIRELNPAHGWGEGWGIWIDPRLLLKEINNG